ncbi:MAG: HRDC domain-containing protein [Propionibacteriaceae bacterium]|jgi:ribonuclease D|nr:HRDC domain-containing protein [Propionibacteriaceae bacterium]
MSEETQGKPFYTADVGNLVACDEDLHAVLPALSSGKGPVAADTERASGFRYLQKAYLIQLKTAEVGIVLIDPINLSETVLAELDSALRRRQWIIHSASQDLPALRMSGLHPDSLFDTELCARLLGYDKVGLGTLVEDIMDVSLAKDHGRSDWSQRPLPQEWLAYAAGDVEFLIEIAETLQNELVESGKQTWAEQEFAYVLKYPGPAPKTNPWRSTKDIHRVTTRRGMAVVKQLWEVRERIAQELDLSPHRVLHDRMISKLASRATTTDITSCLSSFTSRQWAGIVIQDFHQEFLDALTVVKDMDEADLPPLKGSRSGLPDPRTWSRRNPEAARRWDVVRPAIVELATHHNLPIENLIAPSPLKTLLWEIDGSELESISTQLSALEVRPWQCELVAPVIAGCLATLSEEMPVSGERVPQSVEQ